MRHRGMCGISSEAMPDETNPGSGGTDSATPTPESVGTPTPDRTRTYRSGEKSYSHRQRSEDQAGAPVERVADSKRPPYDEQKWSFANAVLKEIGEDFVSLRRRGRNGAWADLEDKIMSNGHLLVTTGLISAKDWIGMAIDIEQFRKAESSGDDMPGDKLAEWLSAKEEPVQ
jgi:hypothetical protein